MTTSAAPQRHDTSSPLTCCPRCHKAELLGRARRQPIFRFDKSDALEGPSTYDMFHGDQHVATVSRTGSGSTYAIRVMSGAGEDQDLSAGTLRAARALAEDAYTESWRQGSQIMRGPVREI